MACGWLIARAREPSSVALEAEGRTDLVPLFVSVAAALGAVWLLSIPRFGGSFEVGGLGGFEFTGGLADVVGILGMECAIMDGFVGLRSSGESCIILLLRLTVGIFTWLCMGTTASDDDVLAGTLFGLDVPEPLIPVCVSRIGGAASVGDIRGN